MFNKQELDDIWENKPYGHFTKLLKNTKGKRKFTVQAFAEKVTKETIDTLEVEVWAKDAKQALDQNAYDAIRALRRKLDKMPWDHTTTIKARVI